MKAKLLVYAAGALVLGLCGTLGLSVQKLSAQDANTPRANGQGSRPRTAPLPAAFSPSGPGEGLNYHGGSVMQGAVRIYYIWYGTWDETSKSILTNFANGIGGSPYFNINTTYTHGSHINVSNSVSYSGSAADSYSLGKSLSDADVGTIVARALSSGNLPTDPNGVYFVLTSSDVMETSGFTTAYCAWHALATLNGANIKYSYVGDGSKINPQACSAQTTVSPNGSPGIDAVASLIAGELNESATDPNLDAWYDATGAENSDKCAWTFGSTYTLPNGSVANVNLGGHDFLIQQNWVNAKGGFCALSFDSVPVDAASDGTTSTVTTRTRAALAVVDTSGVSGSLTGSVDSLTAAANLTTEGTADWVHWGDTSLIRKSGGGAQISSYTVVGGGGVTTYSNDPRPLVWTDGTPTASSTNNFKGIYINGIGKGFSMTAPAGTTSRTLLVHVGGWNGGGTFTAHLSDGSAADYTDTTATANGSYDRNYKLIYHATGAVQTLTVTWKMASGTGNVTLNGAALSGAAAPVSAISATGGVSQSAAIGNAFTNSLQATVKDASNNPISGAPVTFAVPGSGASGTFGASAIVNTDVNGVVNAPIFTANTIAGHYNVVASTPGAASTASFSLTNLVGAPASVTTTSGTPQSATVNTAFASPLVATVKDVGGNLVSGATVTFTALDTSVASGTFPGTLAKVDVLTGANGTAAAPLFTADSLTGGYSVTASVIGVPSAASFNLTNTSAPVIGGGSLVGIGDSSSAAANLTTEGPSDWVHWGESSLSRKAGVAAQLSNFTLVGPGGTLKYSTDPRPLSWTDGTPTPNSSNNQEGIYTDANRGFSFTAPADPTSRKLIVHVGGVNSGGKLTAHLSDSSAADFIDTTLVVGVPYDRNYTFVYHASNAGQTLTVTWQMTSGSGNVRLNAAALTGTVITVTGGDAQSATVNTPFANPLQLTVTDAGSNPISGVLVTFTAPATGASGTLSGPAMITTDVNGMVTAPVFTANTIAGHNIVVARTPNANSVNFNLTNVSDVAASVTATGGTPQGAKVTVAFAALLVATVKDVYGNTVSGAPVTFTPPDSGPTGIFSTPATVNSDSNGLAKAPGLSANTISGTYAVIAGTPGAASANFNLTNLAGTPASLTVASGTPQSQKIATFFTNPLVTTVRDAYGNLASGATVTFVGPGSGASVIFNGTVNATASAISNSNGVATAPPFKANTTAGSYTLSASTPGVATTADYSLTNLIGPPASVTATSGTPQSIVLGNNFASLLVATVKDLGGNPVPGVLVTFVAPASGASGTFSGPATVTTDANGVATAPAFAPNSTNGTYTVVASTPGVTTSANFTLTNGVGAQVSITATGGTPQSTKVNTVFASPLAATVKDSLGNPVGGAHVTFTVPGSGASATFSGPSVVTTDINGVAKALVSANSVAGGYVAVASTAGVATSVSFSLTNQPGPPAAVAATGGTPQSTPYGTGFGSLLVATVKDASGNPTSGVPVTFIAPASGASGTFSGPATVTTDANGVATAPAFTANAIAGHYTVVAGTPGAAMSGSFSLTNLAGPPASVIAIGGTPQSAKITTHFGSLVATVKDVIGNVVSGAPVTFTAPVSGASGTFSGSATVISDVNGMATAPAFTPNGILGTYLVTASTTGATSANFSLTNLIGPPASVIATGGTPQSAMINNSFASALSAIVKDVAGNLVSGALVTFTPPASGARVMFSGSSTAISDVNGVVTSPAFTANGIVGTYLVVASTTGATSANFSLTNLPGPPAGVTATGGTPQYATINTSFGTPLQVTVRDLGGNLVVGAAVTFTAPGGAPSAAFSGALTATVFTDANGIATAPTLVANGTVGLYNVTAVVPGVVGTAYFALTNIPVHPITLIQHAKYNSGINIPSATQAFSTANTAGNWIGVATYGGQSSALEFTVTDTNGNVYHKALTQANVTGDSTMGFYYAENIKGGPNTVKIVPSHSGYLRMVIMEYSGVATSNSLDVAAAAQNVGAITSSPLISDSGTVATTANGDLLLGVQISSDANSISVGPGYQALEFVPLQGTKLLVEDQIQVTAGPANATATSTNHLAWSMAIVAFKMSQ